MSLPSTKKALLGVGAACVLAAVLIAVWSTSRPGGPPPPPAVSQAPQSLSRPASAPSAPTGPERRAEPAPTESRAVVVSEPRGPGEPVTKGRPRFLVDDLRDRMMASNPDLAQFRTLQRKVLLKPEEREMLHGIYKDREQIAAAKQDLLAESETTLTDDNQFRRLYRVEYLGMAMEWRENPERPYLLDTLESLVMAQNIKPSQDLELRRSLSGDKVEMMMILLHNDRPRAERLIARAKGTEYGQLLSYAQVRFDALWALAKQQQQQPQPQP